MCVDRCGSGHCLLEGSWQQQHQWEWHSIAQHTDKVNGCANGQCVPHGQYSMDVCHTDSVSEYLSH